MAYSPFPTKNEDSASADGDSAVPILAVRQDTLAASTNSDGDYGTLKTTNKGEVYVKQTDAVPVTDNGGSLTVDGSITADTELTTADLDTGAGTDTRAVVGIVGSKSGGGVLIPGDATKGLAVDLTATGQNTTALKVDGSAVTQPVSAASLPLPSLAATSTKQSDGSQKTQVVDGSGNIIGSTSNALDVNIKSGSSAGTQYADGAARGTATGTLLMVDDGTNVQSAIGTSAGVLKVDLSATTANGTAVKTDSSAVTQPVSLATNTPVGNVAHDAADSGAPIKIGGKARTSAPTAVQDGDRVDASFDEFGRTMVSQYSPELNTSVAVTSLRDQMVAQRYTVLSDSLADGLASFWTSTTANGGTATSSGGEGLLQTSASATGSAQLVSTTVNYYPGQSAWLNSAVRFSDTGSAGNVRRIGVFTVSGTTPQEGFYFELNGTTFDAVVVKAGTPTAVSSGSWSRFASAPFTLDTNYHSLEIRYTANTVSFYVDNIVRHTVSGTSSAITSTLNFPITLQSINTSGASNRLMAVRNVGVGRFGTPDSLSSPGSLSIAKAEDAASADGDVGTPSMAVRKATPANTSGTDGDYEMLQMSAGRLWTSTAIDTALPAGANAIGSITNTSFAATQATAANLNATVVGTGTFAVQATLAAETTKVIGVTRTADGSGNLLTSTSNALDVNLKTSAATNISTNTAQIAGVTTLAGNGVSGTGAQRVTIASDSTGQVAPAANATATGATISYTAAMVATKVAVNASAGNLYGWLIYNPNSVVEYIQLFNVASASVTLGTTTPTMVIPVPPGGWSDLSPAIPITFGTALTAAATTTASGSTAPTTGLVVTFFIK